VKLRTLFALLALVMIFVPSVAQADKTSAAKKAIEAQYARETGAMAKKDLKTALSVNAPDFVHYRKDGQKSDLKQMKARMEQAMARISSLKASTKITKFALKGSQAMVTTQGRVELTMINPQNKQTANVVVDENSDEIWQNSGGKWLRKQSKTLNTSSTINGQPVPQQP
jgi:hypothetical protein